MSLTWSARRAAAVAIAALALTACSGDSNAQNAARQETTAATPRTEQVPTSPPAPMVGGRVLPDFAPLVESYGPAVVNVEVVERAQPTTGQDGGRGLSPDDPFFDFFRRFPPGQTPRFNAPPSRGTGSGFVVSPDGYILTNAHVVSEGSQVTVRFTDRREYQAKVIGVDERTDVALIKIDAKNLPTVRIGNPGELKPGEWVLAIGSPFGFENSATAGIVSATARSLPSDPNGAYVPFIQTDVAVNPGNSGGPLFNMRGEVIGINSQIFSQTGGYMGLSFAIPIDVATHIQDQLIKNGRVVRGKIGVTIQDVNAQLADSFGLDRPRGALVASVEPDSPSAKAGLKAGDVILEVNGLEISRYGEVSGKIAAMRPGTEAELTVWRDGKPRKIDVRVGELEPPQQQSASRRDAPGKGAQEETARLGLAVRPLAPEEKEQAETTGNLVVEQVSGPAAAAGIQPGDIILGVNNKPVKSVAELQAAAKSAGKSVALLIQRAGTQLFFPLRLS
jgi:serine protease Do